MPKNKTFEVKDYGSGWTAKEITNDMNDQGRLGYEVQHTLLKRIFHPSCGMKSRERSELARGKAGIAVENDVAVVPALEPIKAGFTLGELDALLDAQG